MTPEGCVFVVIVTLIIVSMAATYIAIYLSLLFQYVSNQKLRTL